MNHAVGETFQWLHRTFVTRNVAHAVRRTLIHNIQLELMEPEGNEYWKSSELHEALLGSIDKLGGNAKQMAIIKCLVENYKISLNRNTFHLAVGAVCSLGNTLLSCVS